MKLNNTKQLIEISLRKKLRAFATRADKTFTADDYGDEEGFNASSSKEDKMKAQIVKKHGAAAGGAADRAATKRIFGSAPRRFKQNENVEVRAAVLREQLKQALWEALMYSGKPMLPKTKKPEQTVKKATTSGHKTFQKRASRKIGQ